MADEQTKRPADSLRTGDPLAAQLDSVARGDRRAFETLYAATIHRVLGLASRIVVDDDLADDVASEVYLQVWQRAGDFDAARGSVLAWIMTISRSRALDALRRQSTVAGVAAVADPPPEPDAVQDLLMATDRATRVHKALARLGAADRQLLALAYFRGYSHRELAAMTGEPLGTIKTRIRRALAKLRQGVPADRGDAGEQA